MKQSTQIQTKVQAYHIKTRENMRKQTTQSIRKNLMKSMNQHLNDIISQSNYNPTEDILNTLINYANNDTENAIIQLGNLMLDSEVIHKHLKNKFKFGKNQYWAYLVRVLITFSPEEIKQSYEWIIGNFLNKQITLFMKVTLMETLEDISLEPEIALALSTNAPFMDQLIKTIKSSSESTSQLGFLILSNLISVDSTTAVQIASILKNRLFQIIRFGFLKSELKIRESVSVMLSNLACDGIAPTKDIMNTIFIKSMKQKRSIVKELSYFFLHLSSYMPLHVVEEAASLGMLTTVDYYLRSDSNMLIDNGIAIIKNIIRRLNEEGRGYKSFFEVLETNGTVDLIRLCAEIDYQEFANVEEYLVRS